MARAGLIGIVAGWWHGAVALGRRNPLLQGGAGSALVQGGALATSLILGVLLARGLGPDGYGVYAYAIAILNLLLIAGEVGIPTLLMREVAVARGEERWSSVIGDLRTSVWIVAVMASGLGLLGAGVVLIDDPDVSTALARTALIMLAVLPVVALAKVLAYGLRGLGAVVRAHACELLFRPALVLLAVAAVFWGAPTLRQPEVAMAMQLLAGVIVLGVAVLWIRRRLPPGLGSLAEPPPTTGWLRRAMPFALIGGAAVLTNQTDIVMLGWFRSEAEVGAYRIAQQGGLLTLFVLQAAHSVLGPTFGKLYAQSRIADLRAHFRWATLMVFAATIPPAVVLMVFAREIVDAVFGAAYVLAAGPLAILVAGYLINVALGPVGLLLQMSGRERVTAWVLWATVVLNALLNVVLIPAYGVHGGAVATAVAVVVYHLALRIIAYRGLAI